MLAHDQQTTCFVSLMVYNFANAIHANEKYHNNRTELCISPSRTNPNIANETQ